MPALLSPMGSRFLIVAIPEGRPNTQRALCGRPRADQAVAKCFRFLAGLELGEDLPCLTVDDDECLQGAEPWGDPRPRRLRSMSDANEEGAAQSGIGAIERACRGSAKTRQEATLSRLRERAIAVRIRRGVVVSLDFEAYPHLRTSR